VVLGTSAIEWTAIAFPKSGIPYIIDGAGAAIAPGIRNPIEVPFACLIVGAKLVGDRVGSIVVDIWKTTFAGLPASGANSICAAAPPTLSNARTMADATLAGWTRQLNEGDWLTYNVASASVLQQVTVSLLVTRS
jgi:hypothetical protein